MLYNILRESSRFKAIVIYNAKISNFIERKLVFANIFIIYNRVIVEYTS